MSAQEERGLLHHLQTGNYNPREKFLQLQLYFTAYQLLQLTVVFCYKKMTVNLMLYFYKVVFYSVFYGHICWYSFTGFRFCIRFSNRISFSSLHFAVIMLNTAKKKHVEFHFVQISNFVYCNIKKHIVVVRLSLWSVVCN